MLTRTNTIQMILVVGIILLLGQTLHQVLQMTALVPYVVVSLLSILAFIVKSRFR